MQNLFVAATTDGHTGDVMVTFIISEMAGTHTHTHTQAHHTPLCTLTEIAGSINFPG